MRQVHNLNRSVKANNGHYTDPWGTILRLYGEEYKTKEPFIRGVFGVAGQISVWLWYESQQEIFESMVGFGNPASIDTTFGHCAYVTFFTFINPKLVVKETNTHPTFIGPIMIHSKELGILV